MVDLGFGRGWLNSDAAASLWRVDAQIGHPLQITSAGRTRAEQQAAYDRYLNGTGSFAAYPGTSPHEFGNAIDTNERLVDILDDHGWWRPLSFEPWHFVYRAWADNHINEPALSGGAIVPPTPDESEEDDMKFHLFQLDPNVDGRWVVVSYAEGTYYVVSNGAQLDLVRALPNVISLPGPQPRSFIDGLRVEAG